MHEGRAHVDVAGPLAVKGRPRRLARLQRGRDDRLGGVVKGLDETDGRGAVKEMRDRLVGETASVRGREAVAWATCVAGNDGDES